MERGKKDFHNYRWQKKQTAVNSLNDRFTIYGQMPNISNNPNMYDEKQKSK